MSSQVIIFVRRIFMVSKKITLSLPKGIHAKPASEIINYLRHSKCIIQMEYNGKVANCKSIISLLALAVKKEAEVEISVRSENENEDEEKVLNDFINFLEELFKKDV